MVKLRTSRWRSSLGWSEGTQCDPKGLSKREVEGSASERAVTVRVM